MNWNSALVRTCCASLLTCSFALGGLSNASLATAADDGPAPKQERTESQEQKKNQEKKRKPAKKVVRFQKLQIRQQEKPKKVQKKEQRVEVVVEAQGKPQVKTGTQRLRILKPAGGAATPTHAYRVIRVPKDATAGEVRVLVMQADGNPKVTQQKLETSAVILLVAPDNSDQDSQLSVKGRIGVKGKDGKPTKVVVHGQGGHWVAEVEDADRKGEDGSEVGKLLRIRPIVKPNGEVELKVEADVSLAWRDESGQSSDAQALKEAIEQSRRKSEALKKQQQELLKQLQKLKAGPSKQQMEAAIKAQRKAMAQAMAAREQAMAQAREARRKAIAQARDYTRKNRDLGSLEQRLNRIEYQLKELRELVEEVLEEVEEIEEAVEEDDDD